MQLRRPLFAVLALLCSGAFADCRQASGGRLQGLKAPVIWHARSACGGSTMLWLRSFAGAEGTKSALRVDDLLIIPDLENAQTLSMLAPVDVVCRHAADRDAFVIAAGDWNPRGAQGARQPASRAWRVNPATKKLEELPARDVNCAIR